MKKLTTILSLVLIALCLFTSCSEKPAKTAEATEEQRDMLLSVIDGCWDALDDELAPTFTRVPDGDKTTITFTNHAYESKPGQDVVLNGTFTFIDNDEVGMILTGEFTGKDTTIDGEAHTISFKAVFGPKGDMTECKVVVDGVILTGAESAFEGE